MMLHNMFIGIWDSKMVEKKELLWRRRGRISHVGEFEMTNNKLILAIETSCDETSVSVIKNGTELYLILF